MKSIFAAAISLIICATSAVAAPIWRGQMCLTSVTSACTTVSQWVVGNCLPFSYAPPNLGNNGTATEFSVFGVGFAENYKLASGTLIGTTFKAVAGTFLGGKLKSFSPTMRITSQVPAAPAVSTQTVTLVGDIANFDATATCNVNFKAAATLKP